MTTEIELSDQQKQWIKDDNRIAQQAIVAAADPGILAQGQFVYFAAFDGTNNDQDKDLPDGEQGTNVWALHGKVAQSDDQKKGYFAGPGTSAALKHSSWLPSAVTEQVISAANRAYTDFRSKALDWLGTHEGQPVTVALTAFSRGCASAAIFSQLLYEKGLVADDGTVVIPPGQIAVSAGILFDPVMTGVDGNMAFAPNARNIVDIKAMNEYRYWFEAVNYTTQADSITTIGMLGNHCDIGGGYEQGMPQGIGAISLEAATDYFSRSGLGISAPDPARAFDWNAAAKDVINIHSEQYDNYTHEQWSVYNSDGFSFEDDRQFRQDVKVIPALSQGTFTLYNGDRVTVTSTGADTETVELVRHNTGDAVREITRYDGIGVPGQTPRILDRVRIEIGADGTTAKAGAIAYVADDTIEINLPGNVSTTTLDVRAADGIDTKSISTSINLADGSANRIVNAGSGFDTYYADGGDTIRDADGKGAVYLNGAQLGFAIRKKGEAVYKDTAGTTYAFAGGTLRINNSLTIEGFKNGQLGIYLDVAEDPQKPPKPPKYDPDESRRWIDPLALDLDGDGRITTIASSVSNAYFDFNNDGNAEKTGWIAPGDGLLVLDENGNGVVDGLSDLLGSATQDGFAELAGLDSNADGQIDAQDADYARLRVWQDANGDGISQAGELKGLGELRIDSISLTTTPGHTPDEDNFISATASFTQRASDESPAESRLIADVNFAVDFALTDSKWSGLDAAHAARGVTRCTNAFKSRRWRDGAGNSQSTALRLRRSLAVQSQRGPRTEVEVKASDVSNGARWRDAA